MRQTRVAGRAVSLPSVVGGAGRGVTVSFALAQPRVTRLAMSCQQAFLFKYDLFHARRGHGKTPQELARHHTEAARVHVLARDAPLAAVSVWLGARLLDDVDTLAVLFRQWDTPAADAACAANAVVRTNRWSWRMNAIEFLRATVAEQGQLARDSRATAAVARRFAPLLHLADVLNTQYFSYLVPAPACKCTVLRR